MVKEKVMAAVITLALMLGAGYYLIGPESIRSYLPTISYFNKTAEKGNKKKSYKKGRGGNTSRVRKRRSSSEDIGAVVDELDGVKVYYNGGWRNVSGRNRTADGYNLGLKYQCVEFVKRYYYEHYHHKMPNAGGNAADFFHSGLTDGVYNTDRGLYQFRNGSSTRPRKGDIVVFVGPNYTRFGHIAIIAGVYDNHIQIIQQNPGQGNPSRRNIPLVYEDGRWTVRANELQGWLGKR